MLKAVVVATAAFAIAGGSIAFAQQRHGGPDGDGGPGFERHHQMSAEDRAAFADARIAALKAGLQLTPDQAKNWPAFEQALHEMAQLRIQLRQAREAAWEQAQQGQQQSAPFDRLARRADNLAKVSAALKHVADTGAPLYQSLNDAQKGRFHKLARILRPHHHMHARFGGGQQGWREGHGYGRDGRDGGQGGPWWRHERFGQDDHGRMHRMMGNEEQGSEL